MTTLIFQVLPRRGGSCKGPESRQSVAGAFVVATGQFSLYSVLHHDLRLLSSSGLIYGPAATPLFIPVLILDGLD